MKLYQAKRLMKVAEHLKKVAEDEFNLKYWGMDYIENNECKTICCAVGHACSIRSFKRAGLALVKSHNESMSYKLVYRENKYDEISILEEFFGLSDKEVNIFLPDGYRKLSSCVTKEEVIIEIKKVVSKYYPQLVN